MEPALLLEPAAPVVLLPVSARAAGLAALVPVVRRVAGREGPPDLLGAHQVGAAFNWVIDQALHRAPDAPPRRPEEVLFERCAARPKWKSTQLYQWGRLARFFAEA